MKRFGWVLFGMAVGAGAATFAARRHHQSQLAHVQQQVHTLQTRVAQLEQVEAEYRAKQQQEAEDDAAEEAEMAKLDAEHQVWWNNLSSDERMYIEMNRAIYYSRSRQKYQPQTDDDDFDALDFEGEGSDDHAE